jgi:hypothetical protein
MILPLPGRKECSALASAPLICTWPFVMTASTTAFSPSISIGPTILDTVLSPWYAWLHIFRPTRVRGGQVYGSSDASAAYAAESPVSPDDLAATVIDCLGISLEQQLQDTQGQPHPLCSGKPVLGLF